MEWLICWQNDCANRTGSDGGSRVLSLLGAALSALLLLAALGASGRGARLVPLGTALVAGVMGVVALGALAMGGVAEATLPIGPPWGGALVALDALSAWFLLILAVVAVPAGLFAGARGMASRAEAAALPLFLAGMATVLLAADAFTLLLGFEAMSLASWALIAARHAAGEGRRAARLYVAFAAFSGLCLIGGFALLALPGPFFQGLGFNDMRAAPPEGWRGTLALALILAGAGSKAGLVPFHLWLPLAHPAAATPVSALMSGAMVKVALYVLVRVLFDLTGGAQPGWWGAPLVALGAATALAGAIRANTERDIKAILACSTLENVGLITLALGLALMFRGADLLPLAALALSAALLHALAHAGFKSLLFLVAGAVAEQAGSRDPDRLGGLVHRMPWVAGLALLGAFSAAALPPFSGFVGEWLLLQSLVQSWRMAALPGQLLSAAALVATGMAMALAAAAMVRFVGLVFLGRPRSFRAAGAEDATGLMRAALLVAGGVSLLLAILAAPLLMLAGGAIGGLLGEGATTPASGLRLILTDGGVRYAPWAVAALLATLGWALWYGLRRMGAPPVRRGPAWDCGFQPPPDDMPFGDPLTQASAAGSAQPIRRSLGGLALAGREAHRPATPGSPAAARLRVFSRDRGFAALLLPLARGRRWAGHQGERLRDRPLSAYLALALGTLVVLLALLAWMGPA